MFHIKIGPFHIADKHGTHEPGAVIAEPSQALIDLAEAGTVHPETGLPYATKVAAPDPTPAPAPQAAPEPTPDHTEAAQ